MTPTAESVDFVEELRLRRWARENYCFAEARQSSWHPIVHEEMRRRDGEELTEDDVQLLSEKEAALAPTDSTVLTDEPVTEIDVADTEAPVQVIPQVISPIVPLAPSLPGLHGPHEIMPPHTRTAVPAETTELHFG